MGGEKDIQKPPQTLSRSRLGLAWRAEQSPGVQLLRNLEECGSSNIPPQSSSEGCGVGALAVHVQTGLGSPSVGMAFTHMLVSVDPAPPTFYIGTLSSFLASPPPQVEHQAVLLMSPPP